ncbi:MULTISPECIES: NAD/NADP-dependent octopine/nopaline dehydrogenase family protein [unclassified Pseudomonas]|uniref:NAD/NADP-dependent octopine/nopaline dehydrogenase family protein n=1 Tax=unclassified Pseudomonas TaxID=196821 RepID=UPI000A1EA49F|nr:MULTISPECIES: NAD/NADP-dependent octopine/nopaline dehydrogenase family protein [unclassified Pseudomonas]
MNISIIGCGHGGQALAAHLTLLGHSITLYADEQHPGDLHGIHANTITLTGKVKATTTLTALTTDIELAVRSADIIYLSLPTHAHLPQFRKMLPFLVDNQIVVSLAGNFSALYLYRELRQHPHPPSIHIADTASLPYACRAHRPGHVEIIEIKQSMQLAAMPGHSTPFIMARLAASFPCKLSASTSVLELGLNITSAISHPAIMITNAGRIGEGQASFYFYKEGISTSTANLIQALDNDRISIGQRFGLQLPTYLENMNSFYGYDFTSIHDFFTQSTVHNALKLCPPSINTRYLTQDIPYVMLPWYSLGQHARYQSDVMKAFIDLASMLTGSRFFSNGRNLAEDFLEGMSVSEIHHMLMHGN